MDRLIKILYYNLVKKTSYTLEVVELMIDILI